MESVPAEEKQRLSFPGRLKTYPFVSHFVFFPFQSPQPREAGSVAAAETRGPLKSLWAGLGWAGLGWVGLGWAGLNQVKPN